jgi:hypothetical protein
LGSIRLLDPTKSDPSVEETATMTMPESAIGFSSEVNSLVIFTTIENMEDKIKELDEIMGDLDLGEATDHSDFSQIFSKDTTANFTT